MAKTYLVIGGNSGIGAEIKNQLQEKGCEVVTASRTDDQNILDVTDDEPSFPEIEVLDGLVYCPGTIDLKPFRSLKPEQFLNEFNINCLGAVKAIQHYQKALKKSENGSVVLFSTVAVQTGMPFHASIAAAKGAVEGLTRTLAAEYAPTIRFNAIAPSLTDTPLASKLLRNDKQRESAQERHPLKKVAQPSEMAHWAVQLLMPESGFITGQVIKVDGGMSAVRV